MDNIESSTNMDELQSTLIQFICIVPTYQKTGLIDLAVIVNACPDEFYMWCYVQSFTCHLFSCSLSVFSRAASTFATAALRLTTAGLLLELS